MKVGSIRVGLGVGIVMNLGLTFRCASRGGSRVGRGWGGLVVGLVVGKGFVRLVGSFQVFMDVPLR